MRYEIKREFPGRIRFNLLGKYSEHEALALEESFGALDCVTKCVAYPKAGYVAVEYKAQQPDVAPAAPGAGVNGSKPGAGSADGMARSRARILAHMELLTKQELKVWEPENSLALAPRPRHLFMELVTMTVFHFVRRWFLPTQLQLAFRIARAIPFWKAALASLKEGRLDVAVLDGAAIAMGFIQGNAAAAGSTMFLLNVGRRLEDYTHRRCESSLVRSLLDVPTTAMRVTGDVEQEVDIAELSVGDTIVVRLGGQIPVDGLVVRGEAGVNQSSLTGEPLAIVRKAEDTVYAGTVVEEGELFIEITGNPEESKLRSIVSMVERSEALKSANQKRVESMADKLVPWNFLLAAIVGVVTRDITKVSAALMVDYSCALLLSGSIAVMAAQRESAQSGATVKGSRYFDYMAHANVLVFDKTGTLTKAEPAVSKVVGYNGVESKEVLRLAACLEEHFPHPVARAVVNKALEEGLEHRERHAAVEYVVAHGIASSLDGARVVIGSEHFVIEDEHVLISADELDVIHEQVNGTSPLFLAVDGMLWGVLYIEDPLKENVAEVVQELRDEGFERIIMLTGDNTRAAQRIAAEAGITEFKAELLPEDKQRIIEQLHEEGYKVAMVGDGVNDSPALAEAQVSVAMSAGSAVAREAADISLVSDDLHALVELRQLSRVLVGRMQQGYHITVVVNSLLLALGIGGVITPQTSSLFHNSTTVLISAANARAFLPEAQE